MNDLVWETEPTPRPSIMVVAFEGWFDAASAATGAIDHLVETTGATRLATISCERFVDVHQVRPHVANDFDGTRTITWPETVVHTTSTEPSEDAAPPDLVLVSGTEPHYLWREFAALLLDVARRTANTMIVTLGATAAQTPHTRMPVVHASSTNADLATRFGLAAPRYQGITGIVGVFHAACDAQGVPAISMQVGVPHYATGSSNPKASLALLRNLEHLTGVATGSAALHERAAEWEVMVDEAISESPEARTYVPQLEARYDHDVAAAIPSSDDLAAEFEQYLRDLDPDA
ncbi:MAG: PAC2 family protein [Acidimicrobiia bacterium]